MMPATGDQQHSAVGAYALGVLDEADALRFEEHLAGCGQCAAELDELIGIPPLLAEFATSDDGSPSPYVEELTARPGPELLDRLLDEVGATRRTQRRRRLYLVAAAAVLIVGGPVAGVALTSSDDAADHRVAANPAKAMYDHGEKITTVDPVTKVDAGVSLTSKPWGTHVALKLGNVKGPQKCDLLAVGKNGEKETVTTWAVPEKGYGIKGSTDKWNKEPLYIHGGAAMNREEIARFEIRTLEGKHLAAVNL